MNRLFVSVLVLGLLSLSPQAVAQTPIDSSTKWDCLWEQEGTDSLFECEMFMTIAADGSLSGSIRWTVVRSSSPSYVGRLGLTAVEYISGTFGQASGVLEFRGTRKDDPDGIISLDVYRLEVSPDGRWLFGPTSAGRTWQGRFHAVRH